VEENDIDFGIRLNGGGSAEVRENGVYKWDTPYAPGDVFRVAVVANQVQYSKKGPGSSYTVFYTSTMAPTFPLLMDASLGQSAQIKDAVISGNIAP